MWDSLKQYLKGVIWVAIVGLLSAAFYPAILEFHALIDTEVVRKLSPSKLILSVLGLVGICMILVALLYEAKREDRQIRTLLKEFSPDGKYPGTFRHKRVHGFHICGVCMSPVVADPAGGVACNKCGKAIKPAA